MRADVLFDKKCIHLRLDKETHAHLRARLFKHGLSMQEVFGEFARCFVADDSKAVKIVEDLVMSKVREVVGEEQYQKRKYVKRQKQRRIGELDHDALYNMIEGDADA